MSWLRITGEDGSERAVALGDGKVRIGRAADSDVVLADDKKSVSRVHAEVRYEDGRYVIVDLESQNGTWLNGERVQRAELPIGGEVNLGTFRLALKDGEVPGASTATGTHGAAAVAPTPHFSDVVISHPTAPRGRAAVAPDPPPARSASRRRGAFLVVLAAAAVVFIASAVARRSRQAADQAASASAVQAPVAPVMQPPAPAPAPTVAPDPASAASGPDATPASPVATPPSTPAPVPASAAPRADASGGATIRPPRTSQPPVPRKPGESVESWHNRIAALDARYEYSKAALKRGDFASAASGFEAILRAEPGFGDAPDLLVEARAGLRSSAEDLLAAGRRLDATGDWLGAQQQYERARDVDSTTPGVDVALKKVRDELRTAGHAAFDRGVEQERLGHGAAALQEYTKAVQWLPADDPNLAEARARVERLRVSTKD